MFQGPKVKYCFLWLIIGRFAQENVENVKNVQFKNSLVWRLIRFTSNGERNWFFSTRDLVLFSVSIFILSGDFFILHNSVIHSLVTELKPNSHFCQLQQQKGCKRWTPAPSPAAPTTIYCWIRKFPERREKNTFLTTIMTTSHLRRRQSSTRMVEKAMLHHTAQRPAMAVQSITIMESPTTMHIN